MDADTNFRNLVSLFSPYDGGGYLCARIRACDYSLKKDESFSERTGIIFNILILSGSLTLVVDNVTYVCSPSTGNYVDCKPMNVVSDLRFSEDFDGFIVSISKELMDHFSDGVRPMLTQAISLREKPVLTIDCKEVRLLVSCMVQTIKSKNRKENYFVEQITQSWLKIFISESMNIIYSSKRFLTAEPANRKESLCNSFVELLVDNVIEHHDVEFYANKLCITPRYLSTITQEILSLSPSEMIADELMSKSLILLRSSKTLKEIADELNFSDQASFGKFFKKHTGRTPAAFRSH